MQHSRALALIKAVPHSSHYTDAKPDKSEEKAPTESQSPSSSHSLEYQDLDKRLLPCHLGSLQKEDKRWNTEW
jgi:hypothetical protein